MRRIMGLFLGAVCGITPLWAWRPGDRAVELDVDWISDHGKFQFVADSQMKALAANGEKPLKVAIFVLTRAVNSASIAPQLDVLRRKFGKNVRFALVSPDPKTDIATYLKRYPQLNIPFGVDRKRESTGKYMDHSLLYPMAFVADAEGMILWNGELVDLEEMLESYYQGTFSAALARKLSPALDRLSELLREPDDRAMEGAVNRILRMDPGNAAALRVRLFKLENSQRIPEAKELLEKQLEARPKWNRLYFSLLDLMARYPVSGDEAPALLARYFRQADGGAVMDNLLAWVALNRFEGNSRMIRAAGQLLERAERAPGISPEVRAGMKSTRSLYYYRLGEVEKALKIQREAKVCWQNSDNRAASDDAARREQFFMDLLKLRQEQKGTVK